MRNGRRSFVGAPQIYLRRHTSAILSLTTLRISALSEQQYDFDVPSDSECPSAEAATLKGKQLQRMPVALLDSHVRTYLCLLEIWAGETLSVVFPMDSDLVVQVSFPTFRKKRHEHLAENDTQLNLPSTSSSPTYRRF